MILLAFDFDGVFQPGGPPGPITHGKLQEMAVAPGVICKIVSESANNPWTDFPRLQPGSARRVHLQAFRDQFPDALIRLYVSDNKDYAEADAAGFTYIEAVEFGKGIL